MTRALAYGQRVARARRRVAVLRHIADNEDNASFGDLDLAELYVGTRLRVRTEVRRRLLADELRRELDRAELTADERAPLVARLAALERPEWRETDRASLVPIAELLAPGRHTVVLGDPGCGKSTLLDALAVAAAVGDPALVAALELAEAGTITGLLPVCGSLAAFAGGSERSLHAFLQAGADADLIDDHLSAGTALVLLDGLDEIASERRRTAVVRAVGELLAAFPDCRCVIAARPAGYVRIPGTDEVEVAPLREDQVERCLRSLLRAHARAARLPESDVEGRVAGLLEQIERDRSFAELVHNPLMVAIIAACNAARVVLPQDRVRLYHRMLDTLLRTWELARYIGEDEADETIAPMALWAVWSEVALKLQVRHGASPVPRPALERLIAEELERSGQTPARGRALAGAYLDAAARRAGVLTRRGEGFVFWHPTFGEYLAGFAVAHAAAPRERLLALRGDSRQVEVAVFALAVQAQLLAQAEQADESLRAIAFADPGPWEPLLAPNLRFAAACVRRGCPVGHVTWNRVFRASCERALRLPYEPNLEAFVAVAGTVERRPVEAGTLTLLGPLLTTREGPARVRRAALAVVQRLAEREPRAAELCAAVMADAREGPELRALAGLGLLRAGAADGSVCAALVGEPLVVERTRAEPFMRTAFAVEVGEAAAGQVAPLRRALAEAGPSGGAIAAVLALAGQRGPDIVDALFAGPPEVQPVLGWLGAESPALLERLLTCALEVAAREPDLESFGMSPGAETSPWRELHGACARAGAPRERIVAALAEALDDPARATCAAAVASALTRHTLDLSRALRQAVAARLGRSSQPGPLALRTLRLERYGRFGAAWEDAATRSLFRACLGDARLVVRAEALGDVIDHGLWEQLPEELVAAFVDASVACLAAEADPVLVDSSPKWGRLTELDGARGVCLAAVRRLSNGLVHGPPAVAASIRAGLRQALAGMSGVGGEWAAILLAEADDPEPTIDRRLLAAARGGVMGDRYRQSRAALQCFRRRAQLGEEGGAALPELLWRAAGLPDSRRSKEAVAALRELGPPDEATLRAIAGTARSEVHVDAERMQWLHTNERATEILGALAVGDDEATSAGALTLLQVGTPADERVTAALMRVIESVDASRALALAHSLRRRIHRDRTDQPMDPRVARAWDRCLDAREGEALWLAIDELLWEFGTSPRVLAALRRALVDPNVVVWNRVAWSAVRYAGRGLTKPVDPAALVVALRERVGLAADELFAGVEACCASAALRIRVDAAIVCLALAGPRALVEQALAPMLASPAQEEMRAFELWGPGLSEALAWVLPGELAQELMTERSELRYDVVAAALLQHRFGAPLPEHVRETCLRLLAADDAEAEARGVPSWPLMLLLRDEEEGVRAGLAALRQLLVARRFTLRRGLAGDPRVAALLVELACDVTLGHGAHDREALLHDAREPGAQRDALVGALERRFSQGAGALRVARMLCALGVGSTAAQDVWIEGLARGEPELVGHRATLAQEVATVWPRLCEVWRPGEREAQADARLLELLAGLDAAVALPGLEALLEPLLGGPADLALSAVALGLARGVAFAPAELRAAVLRCVEEADLDELLFHVRRLVPAEDAAANERLRGRVEPRLASAFARHVDVLDLLPDAPWTRPWRVQAAWMRLRDGGLRWGRSQGIEALRRLGASDEALLSALVPAFCAGEASVDVMLLEEVLGERGRWRRRSRDAAPEAWSEPREGVAEAIERGLFLARHASRIPGDCVALLVAALGTTRAAVEAVLERVADDDASTCAAVLELVQGRDDDSPATTTARAWVFGRLPHAALERRKATRPPGARRLYDRLRQLGEAECRRLARQLMPELVHELPQSKASDNDVAERLSDLVRAHGLEPKIWQILEQQRA